MRSKSTDTSVYVCVEAPADIGINTSTDVDASIYRDAASIVGHRDVVRDTGTTAVCRVDKCSAVGADVVVVPVFGKTQSGEVFFLPFTAAENVSAFEAGVTDAILINGDQPQHNSNEGCGSRLQGLPRCPSADFPGLVMRPPMDSGDGESS